MNLRGKYEGRKGSPGQDEPERADSRDNLNGLPLSKPLSPSLHPQVSSAYCLKFQLVEFVLINEIQTHMRENSSELFKTNGGMTKRILKSNWHNLIIKRKTYCN